MDYVWISTASPRSWDLTSNDWANENTNTLNVPWPSGDNSATHAVFDPTANLNGVEATIPPGTVFINGNITVNAIAITAPDYTFAFNSGNLTLVGTSPNISYSADTTFSVPLRGTSGASFQSGSASTITLSAVSTYTGGTTITSGTTSLGINNALPNANITVNGTLALNSFNESFANVTLNANGTNANAALTSTGGILTAASLLNNGTITTAPSAPGALDGDMTVGDLNGSGNITLNGTFLTAGVNAGQIDTYFGNLSGNGSLFKTGSSELILLGNTTLTGGRSAPDITVEGGTLAGNTNSLAGSIDVLSGSALLFAQSANGTFSGALSGTGTITADGLTAGLVLTFTSNNTFTGNLDAASNLILAVSNDAQLGTLVTTIPNGSKNPPMTFTYATFTFDGGTLRTTAALTSARPFAVTQNGGTLDTDAFPSSFSGAFTGNGTLTITGGGTATFSNSLSLNALAINQTTVALNNANLSTVPLTLASTATALALTDANLTLTGYSATAAGAVSLLGNSTLTLSRTQFQSASVSIATAAAATDSAALSGPGSTWTINGNLTLGKDRVVLNPISLLPGVGSLSIPLFSSVSVAGTTTLLANSTLAVAGHFATGALASSTASTPLITISDGISFPPSPALTLGSDTVANATYSGTITNATGSGSIHKIGANTQTLAGADSYTGATIIDGGTLVIASNTALPAASLITNNAILTIAAPSVSANILSGTGTLTFHPLDHLALTGSGASKQSGLAIPLLSSLDIGTNPFILEATPATKDALLSQMISAVAPSRTIISSAVAANPTKLALAVVDNSVLPTPFTTLGGQFVDLTSILITPALHGDSDLSGTVDLNDLNTVLNHLGQSTPAWTSGNFDNAPTIDLTDLNDVLNHLGVSLTIPTVTQSVVAAPEPTSLLCFSAGTILLLNKRRRYNGSRHA